MNDTKDPPQNIAASVWAGIDVSKKSLDVCVLLNDGQIHGGKFENDAPGYAKLMKWVKRVAGSQICHFCMEATGAYSLGLAVALAQVPELVSVVNPYRARRFAQGDGVDVKNDKVDARTLAKMCREKHPAIWQLPPANVRELLNLSRHLGDLIMTRTQQKNRLSEPGNPVTVITSLKALIDTINAQIELVEKSMMDLIDEDPDMRQKHDLLTSIPGIGDRTALNLMAEIPDFKTFDSASALVRYAGLDPTEHISGSSVHKRSTIARKGNRHLRTALYMPTLSAIQHNGAVREFYQRLLAHGKQKKTALVASMRKLLSIAYGVLHSGQPFNVDHRSQAITPVCIMDI